MFGVPWLGCLFVGMDGFSAGIWDALWSLPWGFLGLGGAWVLGGVRNARDVDFTGLALIFEGLFSAGFGGGLRVASRVVG